MTAPPLYRDRESIQPRAFSLRHLVIQEVKFRKSCATTGADERAALDRVARGVDVVYDPSTHGFVIRCEGRDVHRLPLDAVTLYARGDTSHAQQEQLRDVHHWDAALERNRALVTLLVDRLLAALLPESA